MKRRREEEPEQQQQQKKKEEESGYETRRRRRSTRKSAAITLLIVSILSSRDFQQYSVTEASDSSLSAIAKGESSLIGEVKNVTTGSKKRKKSKKQRSSTPKRILFLHHPLIVPKLSVHNSDNTESKQNGFFRNQEEEDDDEEEEWEEEDEFLSRNKNVHKLQGQKPKVSKAGDFSAPISDWRDILPSGEMRDLLWHAAGMEQHKTHHNSKNMDTRVPSIRSSLLHVLAERMYHAAVAAHSVHQIALKDTLFDNHRESPQQTTNNFSPWDDDSVFPLFTTSQNPVNQPPFRSSVEKVSMPAAASSPRALATAAIMAATAASASTTLINTNEGESDHGKKRNENTKEDATDNQVKTNNCANLPCENPTEPFAQLPPPPPSYTEQLITDGGYIFDPILEDGDADVVVAEGSRILSATFGLASRTASVLADSIRIVGDTTAAATGSSARLVGVAVRSVGQTIDAAGSAIEGDANRNNDNFRRVNFDMDENGHNADSHYRKNVEGNNASSSFTNGAGGAPSNVGLTQNTRRLAGRSVRLVGNIVRGVGDSVAFAGSATESFASGAVGVAEDAFRIVEILTDSLSHSLREASNDENDSEDGQTFDSSSEQSEKYKKPSTISLGRYNEMKNNDNDNFHDDAHGENSGGSSEEEEILDHHEPPNDNKNVLLRLADSIQLQIADFVEMASTEARDDMPSAWQELLGVFIACYLSALLLSPSSRRPPADAKSDETATQEFDNTGRKNIALPSMNPNDEGKLPPSAINAFDDTTLATNDMEPPPLQEITVNTGVDGGDDRQPSMSPQVEIKKDRANIATSIPIFLLLLPFRILIHGPIFLLRIFFSRRMALLLVYALVWLTLWRSSHVRLVTIQRNAEVEGFRKAISSLGSSTAPIFESAAWLNAAFAEVWRIHDAPLSSRVRLPNGLPYPDFVLRGVEHNDLSTIGKKETCPDCSSADHSCRCDHILPYGGLEPYISSYAGEALTEVLETSRGSRPTDLAYVSLHSFNLGPAPPLIRGIQLQGVDQDTHAVKLRIDLDVMLDNIAIVLDIKLSSLNYALFPSTKVAIQAVDVRLPLEGSVTMSGAYPFVSFANMSLSEVPDCRVKITPLSDDSGLQGVDLSSLPVIGYWIQDAVESTLAGYVTPTYVSVDLVALITGKSAGTQGDSNDEERDNKNTKKRTNGSAQTIAEKYFSHTTYRMPSPFDIAERHFSQQQQQSQDEDRVDHIELDINKQKQQQEEDQPLDDDSNEGSNLNNPTISPPEEMAPQKQNVLSSFLKSLIPPTDALAGAAYNDLVRFKHKKN